MYVSLSSKPELQVKNILKACYKAIETLFSLSNTSHVIFPSSSWTHSNRKSFI